MAGGDSLILVGVLALCAFACVPRSQFPSLGSRLRWGLIFFLSFLAITAITLWISN
jgi:hypothetical protein